jgi:hypothetical protein
MAPTRDVLVSAQWRGDRRIVSQRNTVLQVRGEQSLEHRDGRIENHRALSASLNPNVNFIVVDEARSHPFDVRRRGVVEVNVP